MVVNCFQPFYVIRDDGDDIYSNRAGSPNGVVSQADAAAVFQLPRFKLKSSGIHANSSYSIKSSGSADSSEFTLESENLANRKVNISTTIKN